LTVDYYAIINFQSPKSRDLGTGNRNPQFGIEKNGRDPGIPIRK